MSLLYSILCSLLVFGQVLNPTYRILERDSNGKGKIGVRIASVEIDSEKTSVVIEYKTLKKVKFRQNPNVWDLYYKGEESYIKLIPDGEEDVSAAPVTLKKNAVLRDTVLFDPLPEDVTKIDLIRNGDFNRSFVDVDLTKNGTVGHQHIGFFKKEEIFTPPTFLGNDANVFTKWMASKLVFPGASDRGGRVTLEIRIDEQGKVSADVFRTSGDSNLDQEALRVALSSPAWSPARIRGIPCQILYTFPVTFALYPDRSVQLISQ